MFGFIFVKDKSDLRDIKLIFVTVKLNTHFSNAIAHEFLCYDSKASSLKALSYIDTHTYRSAGIDNT